jgi:hypothetical protein
MLTLVCDVAAIAKSTVMQQHHLGTLMFSGYLGNKQK